jgi:hypothetical protein
MRRETLVCLATDVELVFGGSNAAQSVTFIAGVRHLLIIEIDVLACFVSLGVVN